MASGEKTAAVVRPLARLWQSHRTDAGSRMTGDCHVRFCERLGAKLPRPTDLWPVTCRRGQPAGRSPIAGHEAIGMNIFSRILLLAGFMASAPSYAERLPVLQQIDLPHPYYFREMYLPQLTSGPSSLAWSPDSRELIYSMSGSLLRQTPGNGASAGAAVGVARQLTAGS